MAHECLLQKQFLCVWMKSVFSFPGITKEWSLIQDEKLKKKTVLDINIKDIRRKTLHSPQTTLIHNDAQFIVTLLFLKHWAHTVYKQKFRNIKRDDPLTFIFFSVGDSVRMNTIHPWSKIFHMYINQVSSLRFNYRT